MTRTTKDKIDKVLGHDPWEIEIGFYVKRGLLDSDIARWWTIRRYMEFNNLRPLRDAFAKAKRIDDRTAAIDVALLVELINLIDQGRLVVTPLHPDEPGKPRSPDLFARDLVGALRYLKHPKTSGSDVAFEEVASELGMSVNALREAVTWLNNAKKEWRKEANTD